MITLTPIPTFATMSVNELHAALKDSRKVNVKKTVYIAADGERSVIVYRTK